MIFSPRPWLENGCRDADPADERRADLHVVAVAVDEDVEVRRRPDLRGDARDTDDWPGSLETACRPTV